MTATYRRIRSADQLLREYAESCSILCSPGSQRLSLHPGKRTALYCEATRECRGSPRQELDEGGFNVWKCSICRKLWPLTEVELGGNETGRCRSGRSRFDETTGLRGKLVDFGRVLDLVERADPRAFAFWVLHVLGPGEIHRRTHQGAVIAEGTVPQLGIQQEKIAPTVDRLAKQGLLPAQWRHSTYHAVRVGIRRAREETMRHVAERSRAVTVGS